MMNLVYVTKQAGRFLQWAKKPSVQHVAFFAAISLFLIGGYLAFQQVDVDIKKIDYRFLLLLGVCVIPLVLALNAAELFYSARLIGTKISIKASIKVSVLASAANFLPLPAGPVLRAAVFMDAGGKAKDSVIAVFLPAFVWMAIGLLLSASAFLVHNRMLLGGGMLGLAFGFAIITGVLFRRYKENSDAAYMVCTVKILGVILDLLALYLVFQSLHYVASLHQITALAASGPLGAAVAIVPAGLGVREVASAGLGNIVGLSAAVSFLVPSLYRLVTMAVLAAVAVCFTYGSRKDDE